MTKMNTRKKRIRNVLMKTAIILIALVITFIYDSMKKDRLDEATGQKGEDAISALGDISKSAPVVHKEKEDEKAEEETEAKESTEVEEDIEIKDIADLKAGEEDIPEADDKFKQASASIADSYREHGEDAVLKAVDVLSETEVAQGGYPITEPDFSNLHPINFRGLRQVYTYFRIRESMPEVVINKLHGAAVIMTGAVMPVYRIPEDGAFHAFWLSNPAIVLAGCVFCSPPTLADIVYVYKDAGEVPFVVDREKLFKQVVLVRVIGRLFFGPEKRGDQTFLFSIQSSDIKVLN